MNEDFNDLILKKIKSEHIAPRPRWQFLLRDWVVWIFGIVLLVVGSLSFSVIIYLLIFNDWAVYSQISRSFVGFLLLTLPYFWIIMLILFTLIINYNIKHSKKGYKFSVPLIVSASVFLSLFFGAIFYKVGVGEALDDVLGENVPLYEKFINPNVMLWENPENGRLAGMIVGRINDCQYNLLDRKRIEWLIDIENAQGHKDCDLQVGRPLKLLGSLEKENYFVVSRIMPHGPGRGLFGPRHMDGLRNFEEGRKADW